MYHVSINHILNSLITMIYSKIVLVSCTFYLLSVASKNKTKQRNGVYKLQYKNNTQINFSKL